MIYIIPIERVTTMNTHINKKFPKDDRSDKEIYIVSIACIIFGIVVAFLSSKASNTYQILNIGIGIAAGLSGFIITEFYLMRLKRALQTSDITKRIDKLDKLLSDKIDKTNIILSNTVAAIVVGDYRDGLAHCKLCINNEKTHTVWNTYIHDDEAIYDNKLTKEIRDIMVTFLKRRKARWIDIISNRHRGFLERFNHKAWGSSIKEGKYECYELKANIPILNFIIITQGVGKEAISDVFFGWGLQKGAEAGEVMRSQNKNILKMFTEIHTALRHEKIAAKVEIGALMEAARIDFVMPQIPPPSDGVLLWPQSYIETVNYVGPHIAAALDKYMHSSHDAPILVLGYELYYLWPIINSYLKALLKQPMPPSIDIRFSIIDPDWEGCADCSKDTSRHAKLKIEKITRFFKHREEAMKQYRWSIEFYTYRHLPIYFGILVGDNKLFLGNISPDNAVLRPEENVEVFSSEDGSKGVDAIEEFKKRFNNSKRDLVYNFPKGD
jgi:hypothetical protein